MIHLNERGNLEFDTKQDLIDYVLSDHCDFEAINSSDSPYYYDYYPDESVRKMYITVYDQNNDPVIEWCCEDQTAHIF